MTGCMRHCESKLRVPKANAVAIVEISSGTAQMRLVRAHIFPAGESTFSWFSAPRELRYKASLFVRPV